MVPGELRDGGKLDWSPEARSEAEASSSELLESLTWLLKK